MLNEEEEILKALKKQKRKFKKILKMTEKWKKQKDKKISEKKLVFFIIIYKSFYSIMSMLEDDLTYFYVSITR